MSKITWLLCLQIIGINLASTSCTTQPRDPYKILSQIAKNYNIDYTELKAEITYYEEQSSFTDVNCLINFKYRASNKELTHYFDKMEPLPVKESITGVPGEEFIEAGYYFIDLDGDDYTILMIDTVKRTGILYINIM